MKIDLVEFTISEIENKIEFLIKLVNSDFTCISNMQRKKAFDYLSLISKLPSIENIDVKVELKL